MKKLKISFLIIVSALFVLGGCKEEKEKAIIIELSQRVKYNFPAVAEGSGYTVTPLEVTVSNYVGRATGALQMVLSGSGSANFILSENSISNIAGFGTAKFTVTAKTELPVDTYDAAITISGGKKVLPKTLELGFVVNKAKFEIGLSQKTAFVFPPATGSDYAVSPLTVTVTNTGNRKTGALSIALSGANATDFALSETSIADIEPAGKVTFTVAPKSELPVGEYRATVTVSGDNGIAQSFDVSFVVK